MTMNQTFKTVDFVAVKLVKEKSIEYEVNKISCHTDAIDLLISEIGSNDRETFCVMSLDTKGNLVSLSIAHIGTLNQTLIHNREIFKTAVLSNANSIIIGHNHPFGELEPSTQDIQYTQAVIKAGNILGIEVLDHIIVNDEKGLSIRNMNPSLFSS